MLTTIQLDNDCTFQAGEVTYIGTDGMLAPEYEAAELAPLQVPPEQPFGICWIFAKFASVS